MGCIPSKALLHVSKVIEEAKAMADHGVVFGEPQTDINKIRIWKEKVINQLTGGLSGMAKMRNVKLLTATVNLLALTQFRLKVKVVNG